MMTIFAQFALKVSKSQIVISMIQCEPVAKCLVLMSLETLAMFITKVLENFIQFYGKEYLPKQAKSCEDWNGYSNKSALLRVS